MKLFPILNIEDETKTNSNKWHFLWFKMGEEGGTICYSPSLHQVVGESSADEGSPQVTYSAFSFEDSSGHPSSCSL
jgi:hypothetical protein